MHLRVCSTRRAAGLTVAPVPQPVPQFGTIPPYLRTRHKKFVTLSEELHSVATWISDRASRTNTKGRVLRSFQVHMRTNPAGVSAWANRHQARGKPVAVLDCRTGTAMYGRESLHRKPGYVITCLSPDARSQLRKRFVSPAMAQVVY